MINPQRDSNSNRKKKIYQTEQNHVEMEAGAPGAPHASAAQLRIRWMSC